MWLILLVGAAVYLMSGIANGDEKSRLAAYGYTVCAAALPLLVDPATAKIAVVPALLLRHPAVREWCRAIGHAVEQRS